LSAGALHEHDTALPRPLAVFKGPTYKGRGGEGKRIGEERSGGRGEEGEKRGEVEETGREGMVGKEFVVGPRKKKKSGAYANNATLLPSYFQLHPLSALK